MARNDEVERQHLIVLGASNVARCVSTLVDVGRRRVGGPCNFLMAFAHGRSFQMRSQVLIRTIPGILDCQIWDAISKLRSATAVITDVGNDLLYSVTPETLLQWVRDCIERLLPVTQRIVLTELPLTSVNTLGDARYVLMRTILFPGCRITRSQIFERAEQVNDGLVQLAQDYELPILKPEPHWYGFDPIHIKQKHKVEAWHKILSAFEFPEATYTPTRHWAQPVRLRLLAPASRRLFGIEQTKAQPAGKLPDGSVVSLF